MTRTAALQKAAGALLGAGLALPALAALAPLEAQARKPGVNRPVSLTPTQRLTCTFDETVYSYKLGKWVRSA